MNVMFTRIGCGICNILNLSKVFVNLHLPIGQKIQNINADSSDPRNSILAKIFKTWDEYEWQIPVTVLEKPSIQKTFNSYEVVNKKRVIIHSAFIFRHTTRLLKNYLEG